MPWYPVELDPLIAIAAATLDRTGRVVEANAGFRRLVGIGPAEPLGGCVARYFLEPSFTTLMNGGKGGDGEIYHGPVTIGLDAGRKWPLLARMWREGEMLHLLAEHDIIKIEQVCDVFLQLNGDYSNASNCGRETGLAPGNRERSGLPPAFADPLTGVGNRRRLGQVLAQEIAHAEQTDAPLCALMADLDHFKNVNDRLGHQVGDEVLVAFADLLVRHTRRNDVVTRFGGDEFIVLLPHTHLADAHTAAEHIRAACAGLRVAALPESITASAGVAEYRKGENTTAFIHRIDRALYQAKTRGRNCVVDG